MVSVQHVPTVFSTLFRIASYLFLRVIPSPLFKTVLPALFVSYLVSSQIVVPKLALNGSTKVSGDEVKADVDVITEETVIVTASGTDTGPDAKVEVNIQETTVTSPSAPNLRDTLYTLLFSLPSPNRRLRILNLTINTLLLIFAADFIARPFVDPAHDVVFTRIGAVEPDAVKIVVRYPQENVTESNVKIVWRQVTSSSTTNWKYGPVVPLAENDDWVNTVKLSGLWPNTAYQYGLADMANALLPYPAEPLSFRTAPDPRLPAGSHFRFIASSCVTPNFPYVPTRKNPIKGFDLLARYLWPESSSEKTSEKSVSSVQVPEPVIEAQREASIASESAASREPAVPQSEALPVSSPALSQSETSSSVVSAASSLAPTVVPAVSLTSSKFSPSLPAAFMLFLGDFIYADVPIYFGDDREAYRRLYRRNYQSASFRKVYERLPIYHIYDDHEILNNFVGQSNDSMAPFQNASSAYNLYAGNANFDSLETNEHFYDFRYGDVAFFVMDTRRHRSDIETDDSETHTMLGDKQLAALYEWLGKVNSTATFKFVVSSVPFTSLWMHDAQKDSWAGFPLEKSALLDAFHSVPNVIIISGDRHEFAAIEFNSKHGGNQVLEFSTSPLSMFYVPFIRTLKRQSDVKVQRKTTQLKHNDDGVEELMEILEEIPQENVLKYIATGNYKWSSFEVDTRDSENPVVHFEVVIDGHSAYRLEILGTPVKLRTSLALGALIPQSFKGMLDKIGLKPSKWF